MRAWQALFGMSGSLQPRRAAISSPLWLIRLIRHFPIHKISIVLSPILAHKAIIPTVRTSGSPVGQPIDTERKYLGIIARFNIFPPSIWVQFSAIVDLRLGVCPVGDTRGAEAVFLVTRHPACLDRLLPTVCRWVVSFFFLVNQPV